MLFNQMDINPQIIQALEENEIVSATEIQEISIPHGISLHRSHVIGQAKTGSGKTLAAFLTAIDGLEGVDIDACRRIAEDEIGVAFRRRVLDVVG